MFKNFLFLYETINKNDAEDDTNTFDHFEIL